jgi:hypothetical protein
MTSWWSDLPPVELPLACGGDMHSVRWEGGTLTTPDHDDPEGEQTLTALGGERCACIDILTAWERHCDDLRVLILTSRHTGDRMSLNDQRRAWVASIGAPGVVGPFVHNTIGPRRLVPRPLGAMPFPATPVLRPGMSSTAHFTHATGALRGRPVGAVYRPLVGMAATGGPLGLPQGVGQDDLLTLLVLGEGLVDRLVATILATWAQRVEANDERAVRHHAALTAALFGRAVPAIRTWLGNPSLVVSVELTRTQDPPTLQRIGASVTARLPFRWLTDIWARNVSVVLGRFALELLTSTDEKQRVMSINPELDDVRPVTISLG